MNNLSFHASRSSGHGDQSGRRVAPYLITLGVEEDFPEEGARGGRYRMLPGGGKEYAPKGTGGGGEKKAPVQKAPSRQGSPAALPSGGVKKQPAPTGKATKLSGEQQALAQKVGDALRKALDQDDPAAILEAVSEVLNAHKGALSRMISRGKRVSLPPKPKASAGPKVKPATQEEAVEMRERLAFIKEHLYDDTVSYQELEDLEHQLTTKFSIAQLEEFSRAVGMSEEVATWSRPKAARIAHIIEKLKSSYNVQRRSSMF